jgi:hypothetical protein
MKKFFKFILFIVILLFLILILSNKFYKNSTKDLNSTDKSVIKEFQTIKTSDDLWDGFDLKNKNILAINDKMINNNYLLGSFNEDLFVKKLDGNIYRLSFADPRLIKIRFTPGYFNTIGKSYSYQNQNLYYIKYNLNDFNAKYSSKHFITYLAHESFHYYMQNNWKIVEDPDIYVLDHDGQQLLKEEYDVLGDIQQMRISNNIDKTKLYNLASKYVEIMSKRIKNNKDYLTKEMSLETAEGAATYVGIKASKLVNYDYGVMYFDNTKDVSFKDVFKNIDNGSVKRTFLSTRGPYETGAELCLLMDNLNISNWQENLNEQTVDNPIYLYNIIKEFVDSV